MPYRLLAHRENAVECAGASIVGQSREVNEDAWGVVEAADAYLVADGCGGLSSGRVAADLAVQAFAQSLSGQAGQRRAGLPRHMDPLAVAVCEANARVFEAAQGAERGMGSAFAAIRLDPPWMVSVVIGDCRIYRYRLGYGPTYSGADARGGLLARLTTDHDLAFEMFKGGASLDEIRSLREAHPNVITRALGMRADLDVDVQYTRLAANDVYLLCSDGLTRQLPDADIRAIISDDRWPLAERCERLVQAADQRLGQDNVTALLVRVVEP
jgi:serine/threonine protein phosphatase PrpC